MGLGGLGWFGADGGWGVGGVGGGVVVRVGVGGGRAGVRCDGAEGDLFLNEASDRLKALHVFELVGI